MIENGRPDEALDIRGKKPGLEWKGRERGEEFRKAVGPRFPSPQVASKSPLSTDPNPPKVFHEKPASVPPPGGWRIS